MYCWCDLFVLCNTTSVKATFELNICRVHNELPAYEANSAVQHLLGVINYFTDAISQSFDYIASNPRSPPSRLWNKVTASNIVELFAWIEDITSFEELYDDITQSLRTGLCRCKTFVNIGCLLSDDDSSQPLPAFTELLFINFCQPVRFDQELSHF